MVIGDERGFEDRRRKRLREEIDDDSELSTDISNVDSDSDSSVKVISEHGTGIDPRIGADCDDDDDDEDYLIQALEDANNDNDEATGVDSKKPVAMEPIDLEAEIEEQQAVEEIIDEPEPETHTKVYKSMKEYKCPICLEPPKNASIAPCGHIFCLDCLFQMVNHSRGQRKTGLCALCRKEIQFRQVKIVILRKKRVRKGS